MTQKLDETPAGQEQSSRVSMVWPAELKEQVRQMVGARGLTDFTLSAVRDKLATMQTAVSNEPDSPDQHPAVNGVTGTEQEPSPALSPDTNSYREGVTEAPEPREGFAMDPGELAKLPLAQRMAHARNLISDREPTARHDRCSKCGDELVNGECWTCPPSYGSDSP